MEIKKSNLVQQVALQLESRLEKGEWSSRLPGIRALCAESNVSKQTMMKALQLLEARGLVLPVKAGQSREVARHPPVHALENGEESAYQHKKIVFISGIPIQSLEPSTTRVLHRLLYLFQERGYSCEEITFAPLMKLSGGGLDRILSGAEATLYVLVAAQARWSSWFHERGLAVVCVGGDTVGAAKVGYSLVAMCEQATVELVQRGHSRIVFLFDDFFSKKMDSVSVLREQIRAMLARFGLPHSRYNTPQRGESVEELYACLEASFSLTPPTAIVVHNDTDIPTVVSYLMNNGLRFPQDVSIISLYESASLFHFQPPISYLKKKDDELISYIFRQLELSLKGQEMEPTLDLVSQFVETGSIRSLS